ncbi:pyrimidine utilization protein D [Pseudomonas sp. Pseusp122]|uniref:pyrimidine utilization protein D n=1 Tax=unclassified Pseudomonas TaxID=196821 RepID=UPI0039A61D4B
MDLYTEVHGPADGEVVLLSSGLGGSANYWSLQIPRLVEAGYRVIAYDQHGTGRSRGVLPADYTIEHMARDVGRILDATQSSQCHFVGHALGGLVGLQLALDFPERVRSLSLVNAWAEPNPHSARCFDARLTLLADSGPRAYVEAQPIFLYPASWCAANAERVQAEVDHAFEHFPGADTMRARIGALRRFDVTGRLGEIGVAVLISVARDDVLVPWTCSEHLARHLPDSVWHCVEQGAHAHNITAASEFNDSLLSFVKNN